MRATPFPPGPVSCRSGGGGGGALALKLLQRPPRGNNVRANHGLPSLKGCQFAEQVGGWRWVLVCWGDGVVAGWDKLHGTCTSRYLRLRLRHSQLLLGTCLPLPPTQPPA